MEMEFSLLCLQEPVPDAYPETEESSPHPSNRLQIDFNTVFPIVFQVVSFLQIFETGFYAVLTAPMRATCCARA